MADIFDEIAPDKPQAKAGDIFDEVAGAVPARPSPAQMSPEQQRMIAARAGGMVAPPMTREVAGTYAKLAIPLAFAPAAAAVGAPVAGAGALAGLGSFLKGSAILGSGGVLGEVTGNAIQRQPTTVGQGARAGMLGALSPLQPTASPLLSLRTFLNAAKGAGTLGGISVAGSMIERAIDEGDISFDSLKKGFSDAKIPALLGAATFGIAGKARNMAELRAEAEAGRKQMQTIGVQNPTLGDVLPQRYAALQERVANVDPTLQAKVALTRSPITKAFYDMLGKVPENDAIAARLQALVPHMDDAESMFSKATSAADAAIAKATAAKANTALSIPERSKLLQEATTEALNEVTKQARAHIAAMQVADSVVGTQTGRAAAVTGVVGKMFDVRSGIYGNILEGGGISATAPLVDKTVLLDAARKALGHEADGLTGKALLAAIEKFKQSAPAGKLSGPVAAGATPSTTLSPEQSRAFIAQLQGKAPPESVSLSLTEFQNLRNKISEEFAGVLQHNPNAMDNAERLASKVYAQLGNAVEPAIVNTFGPQALPVYREAKGFWATTSRLRDTKFGRSMLRGDVTDEFIAGMANRIASGQVDEVLNYKRFVEAIGRYDKSGAEMAMATVNSAIRNSFLQKAEENGVVNWTKLYGDLQNVTAKKDLPFNVRDLGFGDADTVRGVGKILREFKPGELTPDAIADVMQSPQVQRLLALSNVSKQTPVRIAARDTVPATLAGTRMGYREAGEFKVLAPHLREILATKAFEKRAFDAEMLAAAGAKPEAKLAYKEAMEMARRARLQEGQALERLKMVSGNPMFAAFRQKGKFQFTNEAGKFEGDGTVTQFVNGLKREEAAAFMRTMREQESGLADLVERRLLANVMERFRRTETGVPGAIHTVDVPAMRSFFANSEEYRKLLAVLGNENMNKFREFAKDLGAMDDLSRAAAHAGSVPRTSDQAVAAVRGLATGSVSQGMVVRGFIRTVRQLWDAGRYRMASAMLVDDGLANAMHQANGDIGKALAALPAQKAYLYGSDVEFVRDMGKPERN